MLGRNYFHNFSLAIQYLTSHPIYVDILMSNYSKTFSKSKTFIFFNTYSHDATNYVTSTMITSQHRLDMFVPASAPRLV